MAAKRFRYVHGTSKIRHLLLGEKGEDSVCRAWYYGQGTGKHNACIHPPGKDWPVCKNCLARLDSARNVSHG